MEAKYQELLFSSTDHIVTAGKRIDLIQAPNELLLLGWELAYNDFETKYPFEVIDKKLELLSLKLRDYLKCVGAAEALIENAAYMSSAFGDWVTRVRDKYRRHPTIGFAAELLWRRYRFKGKGKLLDPACKECLDSYLKKHAEAIEKCLREEGVILVEDDPSQVNGLRLEWVWDQESKKVKTLTLPLLIDKLRRLFSPYIDWNEITIASCFADQWLWRLNHTIAAQLLANYKGQYSLIDKGLIIRREERKLAQILAVSYVQSLDGQLMATISTLIQPYQLSKLYHHYKAHTAQGYCACEITQEAPPLMAELAPPTAQPHRVQHSLNERIKAANIIPIFVKGTLFACGIVAVGLSVSAGLATFLPLLPALSPLALAMPFAIAVGFSYAWKARQRLQAIPPELPPAPINVPLQADDTDLRDLFYLLEGIVSMQAHGQASCSKAVAAPNNALVGSHRTDASVPDRHALNDFCASSSTGTVSKLMQRLARSAVKRSGTTAALRVAQGTLDTAVQSKEGRASAQWPGRQQNRLDTSTKEDAQTLPLCSRNPREETLSPASMLSSQTKAADALEPHPRMNSPS